MGTRKHLTSMGWEGDLPTYGDRVGSRPGEQTHGNGVGMEKHFVTLTPPKEFYAFQAIFALIDSFGEVEHRNPPKYAHVCI